MRIGLVGDESSHADALAGWLARHPDAGARLTAVVAPTRGWEGLDVVAEPPDLVRLVDAAVVLGRDGSHHRGAAEPLLRAGLSVFVDKPFALTSRDAAALIAQARAAGGRVTSFSALRWHRGVAGVSPARPDDVRVVRVSGPTDPASPHGGRAFYAPHAIELALPLAPGPVRDLSAHPTREGVVLRCRTSCPIEIRLLGQEAPFRARVTTPSGARQAELPLGPDYFDPAAAAIMRFLAGGPSPVAHAEVLDGVRLLEAALRAEACPGR